jgi:cobaltochelatase CobN
MHLLRTETRLVDEAEAAIDLGQTPADILFLSFADSDLSLVAAAAEGRPQNAMSLRLANLGLLKHPYSVDLYVEKAASHARFVLVRLLGGLDYWRYGVEELSRAARAQGFALAVVPGDAVADPTLDAASTVSASDLRRIHAAFQQASVEHIKAVLAFIESFGHGRSAWRECARASALPAAGRYEASCRAVPSPKGQALILFYRSYAIAEDTAPVLALADALAARHLGVTPLFVSSLKDPDATAIVSAALAESKPDIIINTTGFSACFNSNAGVLDEAGVPVLQAILSGATEAQWRENPRGLSAADLAMNVVLPELDGRLISRAIACKEEAPRRAELEFAPRFHAPLPSRVNYVADLAAAWVKLRRTPRARRKVACVLPDYPGRLGRGGYAVGLDTAKSVAAIAAALQEAGYATGNLPGCDVLMRKLEERHTLERFSLAGYRSALERLPGKFVELLMERWGSPDREAEAGEFVFPCIRAGNLLIALQPDRGVRASRKADYHDTALPPCHNYVAFYLWLRQQEEIDALIHCGTHGTLEWLPGKAVALDCDCAPEAVLGPLPVIYPFIVNNPGEAAQAKRRISALTIGHMTPPLTMAGSHGAVLEIEPLFDEYAIAETLDPKRAKRLAQAILARARETGLLQESGFKDAADPEVALRHLDAWLCDLKEMRIGYGLHVFGQTPDARMCGEMLAALTPAQGGEDKSARIMSLIGRCGEAERSALITALDGGFVAPGPGGAPSRGRLDVLPTGRNLYGIDPRAVPTRTAWEIGQRTAKEVLNRYLQDHGEWPRRIVMDLWASATMRTGGDDIAQAFALMGIRPLWDHASARVTGFEILPPACLEHPRVDVTVRISGLFRDIFPAQIAFFDQAVRALSELEEEGEINPLAQARRTNAEYPSRIFGAAPGVYGIGLTQEIDRDSMAEREALGARYLAMASHAFCAGNAEGGAMKNFAHSVATADAFVHVQDQDGHDILESSETVDHEAGFAAAAQMLGNRAPAYHVGTGRPGAIKVCTLAEETTRAVRARAANPRWIEGQMRHGHRGAAEIAESVDNLYALAVLSDAVVSQHFELMFEATLGAPLVRDFLIQSNPKAAKAIAERFEDALARGFWQTRRNFPRACLAKFREMLS